MTFSEIDQILAALGLTTIVVPIIQLLIGVLITTFKRWFIEKKEFSKRVNFLSEKLTEDISILLYQIFHRALNTETNLRGSLPESSDLLNPYHKLIQSHSEIILRLKIAYSVYKLCHRVLFYIALAGVLLSILVLFKFYLLFILALSVLLVIIEMVLVFIMYKKTETLEDFEHQFLKTN